MERQHTRQGSLEQRPPALPFSTAGAQDGGSHRVLATQPSSAPPARCSAGVSALLAELQAERAGEHSRGGRAQPRPTAGQRELAGCPHESFERPVEQLHRAPSNASARPPPSPPSRSSGAGAADAHAEEEWMRLLSRRRAGAMEELLRTWQVAAADTPTAPITAAPSPSPTRLHGWRHAGATQCREGRERVPHRWSCAGRIGAGRDTHRHVTANLDSGAVQYTLCPVCGGCALCNCN
jgi:hypothetical protein